jgi:RHS repeat-associated protein
LITLPGGSIKEMSYDPLMRIKALMAKDPGGNAVLNYSYGYDRMDNIVNKATEHGPYTYNYDSLYRLSGAVSPVLPLESFTYDPVGNRLSSATANNWTYNGNNELQSYNGASFQYDANGNTILKSDNGDIQNFRYNEDDRLTEVKNGNGAVIATYYYDPFGRRLWKDVGGVRTNFMYADEGLIAEFDGSGSQTKAYGYKPGSTWTTDPLFMKQAAQYYFYHNDHLGTPQKIAALNGGVVWSAKYESFGKAVIAPASTVENNLRFSGQYYDQETGIYYNYHRYHAPSAGRYLTPDPIGLEGGLNLFTHVQNNPVNLIDPSGEIVPIVLIAAGATVGAVIGGGIYALTTDNFTWGGLAGSVGAGAIAGGVGVIAPAIAGSLGLGSGFAGTAIVNATAGIAGAGVSAGLDPCQDFTLGYAASSAAFGALGGYGAQKWLPVHGMSNFSQIGFPRTLRGVTPKIFGGALGPNALNSIYAGGLVSVGVGASGPVFIQ